MDEVRDTFTVLLDSDRVMYKTCGLERWPPRLARLYIECRLPRGEFHDSQADDPSARRRLHRRRKRNSTPGPPRPRSRPTDRPPVAEWLKALRDGLKNFGTLCFYQKFTTPKRSPYGADIYSTVVSLLWFMRCFRANRRHIWVSNSPSIVTTYRQPKAGRNPPACVIARTQLEAIASICEETATLAALARSDR